MVNQFADYVVLELILGERIVEFMSKEIHALLYIVPIIYFIHAGIRYNQRKKLITLREAANGSK